MTNTVDVAIMNKLSSSLASFPVATEGTDITDNAGDAYTNRNYSHASFDTICVYPLWSCALRNNVIWHPSDNQHSDNVDVSNNSGWPTCAINAKVESYFRGVKHGRLAATRRNDKLHFSFFALLHHHWNARFCCTNTCTSCCVLRR